MCRIIHIEQVEIIIWYPTQKIDHPRGEGADFGRMFVVKIFQKNYGRILRREEVREPILREEYQGE